MSALTSRSLVFLQLRGSGVPDIPDDPATYRCDRMMEEIEALRRHLELERMDLIAHSQSGDLALMYAAAYPRRLCSLVLVTPVSIHPCHPLRNKPIAPTRTTMPRGSGSVVLHQR